MRGGLVNLLVAIHADCLLSRCAFYCARIVHDWTSELASVEPWRIMRAISCEVDEALRILKFSPSHQMES